MEQLILLLFFTPFVGCLWSRSIVKKYSITQEEYKGSYEWQTVVSFFFEFLLIIFFFWFMYYFPQNCEISTNNMGFTNYCRSYYDEFTYTYNWYVYLMIPSLVIFFSVEFFIRVIIYKNRFIYPILNTFFLLGLPLTIAYMIENIQLF
jgi:hypothetical protein